VLPVDVVLGVVVVVVDPLRLPGLLVLPGALALVLSVDEPVDPYGLPCCWRVWPDAVSGLVCPYVVSSVVAGVVVVVVP
jgi:hypothetical protein